MSYAHYPFIVSSSKTPTTPTPLFILCSDLKRKKNENNPYMFADEMKIFITDIFFIAL